MSSLTWFTSARELAEGAASKLRALEADRDGDPDFIRYRLNAATDELRLALNRCEDTARSLVSRNTKNSEASDAG